MKLSFEQLKSIARGTDRLEEVEGGVQFFRMTAAQKQYYLNYNNIERQTRPIRRRAFVLLFIPIVGV